MGIQRQTVFLELAERKELELDTTLRLSEDPYISIQFPVSPPCFFPESLMALADPSWLGNLPCTLGPRKEKYRGWVILSWVIQGPISWDYLYLLMISLSRGSPEGLQC